MASSGYLELLTSPAGSTIRQMYGAALASALTRGSQFGIPDTSYALLKDQNIYELVRRDAVIFAAMEARKHAVASSEYAIEPGGDTVFDSRAATVMGKIFAEIENFDSARLNLSEAVFRGSAYAKIEGKRQILNLGNGPQSWWIPTAIIDVDRRRVRRVLDRSTKPPQSKYEVYDPFDRKWNQVTQVQRAWFIDHVYDDAEISLGWGRGLLDAIYHYWYAKATLLIEALNACERWGQGQVIVKVDPNRAASTGKDNATVIAEAVDIVEKTRARHVLGCMIGDEIEVVNGPGEGWQALDRTLTRLDNGVTQVILGSVLPGGGESGDGAGSFARASVEENSKEALIHFDRRILETTLTRTLVDLTWKINRGNFVAMGLALARRPKLSLSIDPAPDPKEVVDRAVALHGIGVDLKSDELYKGASFTMPAPGDRIVKGGSPAPASPFGFGGGGFGGERPDPPASPTKDPGERTPVGQGASS